METDDKTSLRVASFSYYLDTAKENLVHRVSAQEKSNPTTIKPPFGIKFSQPKESQESLTNLRVDSFSYLNSTGDNFIFEVPGPIQDPTTAFTFSQEIPKDGEISVFGADKYFNTNLENQTNKFKNEKVTNIRPKSTPSLSSSEASTFNSQSALQHGSQTKQKRATRRTIFTSFGCKGPCFDKKSVHINGSKPITTGSTSSRINHLGLIPVNPNPRIDQNLDDSRPSIEVFGSKTTSKEENIIAKNLERKLSMLTWDAIPKGKNLPTSSSICDDMASEASSDLFEIENISGSINPLLLSSSEPADDLSSCMSPTNYAPSEASIQWSVVTASAADYPVLSDYNDETSVSVAGGIFPKNDFINRSSKTRKEAPKSRPSGILGCKSLKAVDVADNVCHKSNGKLSQATRLNGPGYRNKGYRSDSLQTRHGRSAHLLV